MKNQRKTEIKVGLMVIIGIILFLWILGWAKNFSLISAHNDVLVRFDNVAGLEIGDHVTVNGVRKGFVSDFDIENGDVIVKIAVGRDVNLKSDAVFSIAMLDLMGGKRVEIFPGAADTRLDLSKIHKGNFDADIPLVMSMLGSIQNDLVGAMKDIQITLGSLNNYLTDEKLQQDIKSSLSNLNSLTIRLNRMIEQNAENINKLTSNAVILTEETSQLIADNKENIKTSMEHLVTLMQKTDTLLTTINTMSDEVKRQQNNLGRILYDEKLFDDLTSTLKQANELTRILIDQLQREGIKVDAKLNIF